MTIDHIGIAVKAIDNGVKQWTSCFGYIQRTRLTINTKQKVKVVFLSKKNSIDIKLIEPLDETSPIYNFVKRGGGLHHICFKTDDMEDQIDNLKANRMMLISPSATGEAFNNHNIAFLLGQNNLNIELIDTDERANEII